EPRSIFLGFLLGASYGLAALTIFCKRTPPSGSARPMRSWSCPRSAVDSAAMPFSVTSPPTPQRSISASLIAFACSCGVPSGSNCHEPEEKAESGRGIRARHHHAPGWGNRRKEAAIAWLARMKAEAELASLYRERALARAWGARRDPEKKEPP